MIFIVWTGWTNESGYPESFHFETRNAAEKYLKQQGYKKEKQYTGEELFITYIDFCKRERWARVISYPKYDEGGE